MCVIMRSIGVCLSGMQWRGQTLLSMSGSGPEMMDQSLPTLQMEAGSSTRTAGSAIIASLIYR